MKWRFIDYLKNYQLPKMDSPAGSSFIFHLMDGEMYLIRYFLCVTNQDYQ
jgi:hypothetical protein